MGGGGGGGCRLWGLVIGFLLVAAGGWTRGGVYRRGLGVAGVGGGCRVARLWPGLGGWAGGMVWGWYCWWWGRRGWVLCWMGVWASRWDLWVLRVRTVRSLWSLAGCRAEVRVEGGCLGIRGGCGP